MGEIKYTFKEVCDITGYKPSVIRYYEKEFKLDIPRDANGRRFFSQKELDKLIQIKNLQQEGYTNGQIKKIMEGEEQGAFLELATTKESCILNPVKSDALNKLDEKLNVINSILTELNKSIVGKDKDALLSENMKLRMEIKQKTYEIMELKEKLRYEKERNAGFFSRILKRKK
ncbi:MerR family transcriptional regulator [Fonticella tunisiensis]|uniref:MerR-like DNA binding protein n=1 Tax=Fonticella tunisiensis TaxID=1096341 RepID=A0A4R7KQN1_9CLOT|nr:MerR family transcriptional regulator [Fonticella tunisiensis]TDT61520.1 MerR-like DNA binding protein [Fonticella tunisiensis]